MQQGKKLKQEILATSDLKLLTKAYQEHAVQQINLERYSIVGSREFVRELDEILFNVKSSYKNRLLRLLQQKKNVKNLKYNKNKKEVIVLMSPNNKLYGDLIPKIFKLFLEKAKGGSSEGAITPDIVIVGKQGKQFVEESDLQKNYTYFEMPDRGISKNIVYSLRDALYPYEKVTVFCGKFINIVSQEAVEIDVSGTKLDDHTTKEQQLEFLFEPSLEEVLDFFETMIFSLLLDQTVHESSLARFASRFKAMESAQTNIEKQLKKITKREKRLREMDMNRKQLALLAGRPLWNKRMR